MAVTRTKRFEVMQRRARLAELFLRGQKNQTRLAELLGVDQGTISRDLEAMNKEWQATYLGDVNANKAEIIGELEASKAELWAAWERSKKPKERQRAKTVKGSGRGGSGDRQEGEKSAEGRDGNPKFLQEIREIDNLIARLRGLITNKVDVTTGGESFFKVYGFDPEKPEPAAPDAGAPA